MSASLQKRGQTWFSHYIGHHVNFRWVRLSVSTFRISIGIFVCTIIALQSGCEKQLTLIPLRGKVIYQAKPLEYGSVMLQPTHGGPVARGVIQQGGTFVLTTMREGDGVLPGKSRVRVTAFEAQRQQTQSDSDKEVPLGKSAIPEKFHSFGTSGLTIEISANMKQPVIIDLDHPPS